MRGDAQGTLTEKELLHNCIFLLNAGHETSMNLICNALVALVRSALGVVRFTLDTVGAVLSMRKLLGEPDPNRFASLGGRTEVVSLADVEAPFARGVQHRAADRADAASGPGP